MWRFLLFSLFFLPLPALAAAGPWVETDNTRARLISEVDGTHVGPGGALTAGIEIELKEDWKTYWRMPGDAGLPPQTDWSKSENLRDVEMLWPAPERHTILGIDNIGYEKKVVFPVVAAPSDTTLPLKLNLDLNILVCSEICLPEKFALTLDIPAGPATPSAEEPLIDAFIDRLPETTGTPDFSFTKAWIEDGALMVQAHVSQLLWPDPKLDLFVENSGDISFARPQASYNPQMQTAVLRLGLNSVLPGGKNLSDVLSGTSVTLTAVGENIASEGRLTVAPPAAVATVQGLLPILALAVLGGLILNLMPCVLPVLSLKLLSVVSHGGSHAKNIRAGFLAAAAGILFSFLILAASIIALKNAGMAVGWGLQFQHPAFLIFMIALLLLFAANLWGLFEIPLPRFIAHIADKTHEHEPTLAGHFFTGALATLLATPCTAPFLGTAVGFALSSGAKEILAVFLALGLGLALPYLSVAAFPAAVRLLPRPGRWMVTLKKILGLALLATAAWLAWVLIGFFSAQQAAQRGDFWVAFDESKIPGLVAEGKTVFVDVTADWCLTCQANKKLVLDSKDIQALLGSENVVAMIADWTKPDPAISAYLKTFGRYGIPFNAIYGPAAPQGIALPELLTGSVITDAVKKSQNQ